MLRSDTAFAGAGVLVFRKRRLDEMAVGVCILCMSLLVSLCLSLTSAGTRGGGIYAVHFFVVGEHHLILAVGFVGRAVSAV